MQFEEIEKKILSIGELEKKATTLRQNNQTIVTNNGSYDILHLGHLYGFFDAKKQGDCLIVGINSDKSVRSYKGPNRPINDEAMRLRMVGAISCVDYVFLFDDLTPNNWLEQIKPDVHTNGAEYGDDCIEKEVVLKHGGRIHLLPMIDGYKTTAIIEKIKAS